MITDFSIGFNLYAYIRYHLPRGKTILELGSGEVSSLLSLDYQLYSVEHDQNYIGRYNTNYIYAPIKDGWYDIEKEELPNFYDLLLIDGPPEKIGRYGIIEHLDLFDLTNVIVDDTHREMEKEIATAISDIKDKPISSFQDGKKEFIVL